MIGSGYANGYPRSAENGTPILINGIEHLLIGRVSMDLICVGIGHNSGVKVGNEVTLWGRNLSIEHIASCSNVIPYELFTGVSKRVQRYYSSI